MTNGLITGYHLSYQSITYGGSTVTLLANSTSHLIKGLEENAMYRITLGALNMAGVGENSSVNIKTPIAAPSEVPRNFRSTVVNASTVQLTWQPPSDVHHNGDLFDFVITYRNDNGSSVSVFEARVDFVNGTADYEFTLSNLETYNTYTLTVAARNMAGIGPRSIVQIRTPEDVPGPVESTRGEPLSPTSLLVVWSSPVSSNGIIVGYEVTYALLGGSDSEETSVNISSEVRNLTIVDLTPSTSYRVSVAARTSAGVGESTSIDLSTDSAGPSGTPLGFSVRATGPRAVEASWRPPTPRNTPVMYYMIRYQPITDSGEIVEMEVNITAQHSEEDSTEYSYPITGLEPFSSYAFFIKAVSSIEEGPFTSLRSVRTPADSEFACVYVH
jgi:protein sidekick